MTTLTQPPIAPLLEHLFAQAAAATSPALAQTSKEERERLLRSKTEYRDFYSRLKDLWLPGGGGGGPPPANQSRRCRGRTI
ncbi:MAG: O-methyltransferase, partial [Paraburkholderia tropica]